MKRRVKSAILRTRWHWIGLSIALLVGGCARSNFDRTWLAEDLASRVPGATLRSSDAYSDESLPPGVSLDDGLDEDEAVSIALWMSPNFQADLAQLSLARADLADAGALPNPTLTALFPLGPHQLSGYLLLPLSALAQRPAKVRAAKYDVERVAHSMLQTGLDLIRDVRIAHAEAVAADERAAVEKTMAKLWEATELLMRERSEAGDIGRLELDTASAEALIAADLARRADEDVSLARLRLRQLLGVGPGALTDGTLLVAATTGPPSVNTAELVREALACRPDLRATELAVEAAGHRLKIERAKIFSALLRLDGQLDSQGFHPSVGIHQLELPIFNWNRGGRERATAEIDRAMWRYAAARQQIVVEVASAEILARQADESLNRWRDEVVITLERAVNAATSSYREGEDSNLIVLSATRRLGEARRREIELRVDLRRALATLDRNVGRKLPRPERGSNATQDQ